MEIDYPPNWDEMSVDKQSDWFITQITKGINRMVRLNILILAIATAAIVISVFALLKNN